MSENAQPTVKRPEPAASSPVPAPERDIPPDLSPEVADSGQGEPQNGTNVTPGSAAAPQLRPPQPENAPDAPQPHIPGPDAAEAAAPAPALVEETEPTISAAGLSLTASRGPVYGPLDLEVPTGWLIALIGPQGTGRTALLLTLAGRMKQSGGRLRVLGRDLPKGRRHVQHRAALANFESLDELDDSLRVRELFNERAGLVVPLWVRPTTWQASTDLIATVFGDDTPPDPASLIWQLTPLQVAQLRVLLALLGGPHLLLVDDIDTVRDPADQTKLWQSLQRVCGRGITVVAAGTSTATIPDGVRVVELTAPDREN